MSKAAQDESERAECGANFPTLDVSNNFLHHLEIVPEAAGLLSSQNRMNTLSMSPRKGSTLFR